METGSAARARALSAIQRQQALELPDFVAPRSLEALAAALEANPSAQLLAGGTDVGLWVTKQLRDLPPIIYLGEVAELKLASSDAQGLSIGAAVPLTDAWRTRSAPIRSFRSWRCALPPRRCAIPARLCGNLANGSPIGDSMPALIALGAKVELRRGAAVRRLPLEQLYLGYQRKDLAPGEFLVRVPSRGLPRAMARQLQALEAL